MVKKDRTGYKWVKGHTRKINSTHLGIGHIIKVKGFWIKKKKKPQKKHYPRRWV